MAQNTYIDIPNESNPSVSIASSSLNITVNHTGGAYTLGFDPTGIVATQSAAVVTTFTAGETLSALKAVYYDQLTSRVFEGSPDTLIEANITGITISAALPGEDVQVIQYGLLSDNAFNLSTTDLVFCGDNGALVTTAPSDGFLSRLGRAINNKTILVLIESPVTL